MTSVNVSANRAARKYPFRTQFTRVLWTLATPLFRLSPRPFWGWRRLILRAFGAKIGRKVHIYPTVRIIMPWNLSIGEDAAVGDRAILYSLGFIEIGPRATISQGAHLCAGSHDISRPDRRLLKLPIVVGADVWIAADVFVGPGVTINEQAVAGARAVVTKDVAPSLIVVGNPAQPLREITT